MKVIRAPLRVSLFGGGTDLDPFCSEYGSTIISFALNRHIYLSWNERHTGGCRLTYSRVEELDSLRDAEHTLVRETAQRYGIPEPCTLTIVSDLPKGTGLGSSSALAVALVRLNYPDCEEHWLWKPAAMIEQAHSRAGWQDYLPATFGGFRTYYLQEEGLSYKPECVSGATTAIVNTHGLLLYTGESRPADSVLGSWQKSHEQLMEIKILADAIAETIDDVTPEQLGYFLDMTWQLKRKIGNVSNGQFDIQYDTALDAGAMGGKLCGAGAGGCWFFLVPPASREIVVEALGLREIPFQVSEKGVESWEL